MFRKVSFSVVSLAVVLFACSLIFNVRNGDSEGNNVETGSGAIAYSFNPSSSCRVTEVRVHLNAAGGAGDLTITLDSALGSAYDVVFLTQDMTTVTDLVWQPSTAIYLSGSDELEVAWANGSSRTYGLEILYK